MFYYQSTSIANIHLQVKLNNSNIAPFFIVDLRDGHKEGRIKIQPVFKIQYPMKNRGENISNYFLVQGNLQEI